MYRQYENYAHLKERLQDVLRLMEKEMDPEQLFELHEDAEDLRERINFAVQDEEADLYSL